MDDRARQQLADLYATEGRRIVFDAQACEGLLRDRCGECKKEIAVLAGAVKCGVPTQIASSLAMPRDILRQRLIAVMEDQGGFERNAAGWAVDTWRAVLDPNGVETNGAGRTGSSGATPAEAGAAAREQREAPRPAAAPSPEPSAAPKKVTLPPAAAVIAAFRERAAYGSPNGRMQSQAREYAAQELKAGKTVDALRAEMVEQGYPKAVAEALMWTGYLAGRRATLQTQGKTVAGVGLALGLWIWWSSTQTGATPSLLWPLILLIAGAVRYLSGSGVTDLAASAREARGLAPVSLPPASAVLAAYREKRDHKSPEVAEAAEYVHNGPVSDEGITQVRDDLVRHGYPRALAEALIWSKATRFSRVMCVEHAQFAGAAAVALTIFNLVSGTQMAQMGIPPSILWFAALGAAGYGAFRFIQAQQIPNWADREALVRSGKEVL